MKLSVDPKLKPTPEQMERAVVADDLFRLHNFVNIEISRAVTAIMIEGADCEATVKAMILSITQAAADTAERLRLKQEDPHA